MIDYNTYSELRRQGICPVEYLEVASAPCRIVTGDVLPSSRNFSLTADYYSPNTERNTILNKYKAGGYGFLFGVRNYVASVWTTSAYSVSGVSAIGRHTMTFRGDGNGLYLDFEGNTRSVGLGKWNQGTGTITMLCRSDNSEEAATKGVRLYSVKFIFDGVLTRDFIPVRKGNVGYMYDLVSKRLFGNSGSGTLTYGEDIILADSMLGETFEIFNADGTSFHDLRLRRATHDSTVMSLGDKITGDVYYKDNTLAVTMKEYVEYEGVRYVLVNPPTVVREGMASDNGQLKGMTKYSFEFYHPMCMLGNFPFTDVAVKSDEEQYLSQNKTFSWIGNCFDFIAKLNKNLESTQWVVVSSDDEESRSKMGVLSDVLTFDKSFISDALKTAYDTWSVPFVIENLSAGEYFDSDNVDYYTKGKRFVIVFGLPSNEILDRESTSGTVVTVTTHATADIYYYTTPVTVPANQKIFLESLTDGATPIILNSTRNGVIGTTNRVFPVQTTIYIAATKDNAVIRYSYDESKVFVFKFGQGVGLKNNSRTPRNNKIVTRLAGYGSERNIPYGYPQIVWTGSSTATCTVGSSVGVKENVTINGHHYDRVMSYPLYDGIVGGQRVKLIKHPFTRNHLMPSVYSETVNKKVNPYAQGFDPDIEIVDYYDAPSSYPNPIVPSAPSFEIHEFADTYPELGEAAIVNAVPYNQEPSEKTVYSSVSDFLYMLQNSINNAANANEAAAMQRLYNALNNGATTYSDSSNGGAYTYSVVVTSKSNGVMYVKYTSGNFNIDTTVRYAEEETQWIDDMDDDGNYLQSYFKITLPKLSFDIYACASITEKMDINMRSGACIGCTFPVYVDWEDYKKNFYTSDGVFAPDGAQRDLTKYPKSNQGQITVLVKKEIETFGTLMPNIYQTPKAGDKFVVLGISLPLSYITSAEERLDDAMMEYMLENNVHYYDYPLKFDEHFLATHLEILSQIRNNTIVRFKYGNEPTMALYVKQMTVKYGEKVLPQFDITLTDDVEIVLNQIGQVTDDVSRMRVQMSELQKYYSQDISDLINEKLSRVADDVAEGRITFQQGLDSIGSMILSDEVRSSEFITGLYTGRGWRIDALGNAEMESLRVRSYLEVIELLINRLQAQEGDTVFTDNDQVEKVDTIVSSTDGSVSYVLSLKEKYDGYVTGQMYGNIVKGIINTLAAKQAGVSDVDDTPDTEHDGENSYFTSWMRVVGTHATDSSLGINQIRVELYSDDYTDPTTGEVHREIPSGKNFAPCELMTIARWGCYLDPDEEGISSAEKLSRERRQRMFMISVTDGRVVKHTKVNKPILSDWNYGVTIGELPEFVKNYPNVKSVLDVVGEHTDWLYAQGVVVEKFIKVDVNGKPEVEIVDCGDWVDGSTGTPSVRAGIYYHDEWNSIAQQYETHDVWHNGALWRCLVSQPVVSEGVTRFYEPTDENPTYWKKLVASGESGNAIWTTTNAPTTPNYTFTKSTLIGSEDASPKVGDIILYSYYRYTITSVGDTTVRATSRQSIRGATGASNFSVSIDKSFDAVACDGNGKIKDTAFSVTLHPTAFYGTTNVLSAVTCTPTYDTNVLAVDASSLSTGISVSIKSGVTILDQDSYGVSLAFRHATYGTRTLVFTLGAVRDGQDAITIDLDNESDSIGLDSGSKAVVTQTKQTNARLWLGSKQVSVESCVVALGTESGSVPSGITESHVIETPQGGDAAQVSVMVTVAKDTKVPYPLYVDITALHNSISKTARFSIGRTLSGKEGVSPAVMQLYTDKAQFAFQRTSSGGYTPSGDSIAVKVKITEGNSAQLVDLSEASASGLAVCALENSVPTSYDSSRRIESSLTVLNTDVAEGLTSIGIALFDMRTTPAKLLDSELLPIVKDGANGAKGDNGANGTMTQRCYKSTNSSTAPTTNLPSGDTLNGWSLNTPTAISSSQRYRYRCERSTDSTGAWSAWTPPVIDGYMPEDGTSISIKGRSIGVTTQECEEASLDAMCRYILSPQVDQSIVVYGDVVLCNGSQTYDKVQYIEGTGVFRSAPDSSPGDCYIDLDGHLWQRNSASTGVRWVDVGQIKGEKGDKGDKGDDGDNAVQYQLQTDPSVVNYATDENGIYIGDDVTVNGTAVKTDGDSAPVIGDSGSFQVFVRPEYTNMSTGGKSYLSWSGAANTKSYLLKKSLATHRTLRITAVQFKIASSINADAIVSAVVPVVLGGIQGVQGLRGKTGRFYYYAGTFDSSNDTDEFVVSDAEAPYFETGKLSYHIFNYDVNGRYTMSDMWDLTESSGSPAQKSFNNAPWEPMTSDFKYLITEAIFGSYAHFGSAIINKDWLLSGNGTIDGTLYKSGETYGGEVAYTRFDPLFPYGAGNATISVKTSVVSWNTSSGVRPLTDAMSLKAGKVYAIKVLCHVERTYAAIQADTFPQIRFWFDDGESGVSELIGTTDQSQYDKEQLLQKTISVDSDGEYTVDAELMTPTNYGSGYVTMIVLECKTNDMFVPMYCVDLLSGETSMAGGRVRADARGDLSIKGALMYSSIRQDIFTSTDGSEYFLHQGIYTGNKLAPRIRSNYFCINGSLSYTTDSVYNVYMPPARLFEGMEITIINNAKVRTDSSLQVPLTLSVPTDFDDIDPVKDDASPTVATIWNRFAILFPSDKVAYEGGGGLYGYSIKTTGASVIKLVATMHPEIEFTHPSGSSPSQAEYNKSCIAWCVVDVK